MHRILLTTLCRLTAGVTLLNAAAPAVLTMKGEIDAAQRRHQALLPPVPAPMKGVPILHQMETIDPSKYLDPAVKDAKPFSAGWTLLNEQGDLRITVAPEVEKAWRIELNEAPAPERRVRLLTMLGEADLARHEPVRAQARFNEADRLAPKSSPDKGLVSFDAALSLFRQGRFTLAKQAFRNTAVSGYRGVDFKISSLYARHAELCEGYHKQRELLGIPEPERLDPQCGIAALAVCLRGRHMPHDRTDLARKVRFDGEGSSMLDLQNALPRLGLSGQMVKADDEGLKRLPKPLVAFVEHDHFVAVVDADRSGVEYVCSDCGPWPGGPVRLTWKQWRMMEAGQFLAVAKRGTPEALALDELPKTKAQGPAHIAIAAVRPQNPGVVAAAQQLLSALGTSVIGQGTTLAPSATPTCGVSAFCLHCVMGQLLALFSGGFGGSFASTGDPVNLATAEEEYTAPEAFDVYNPTGPSVSFRPSYFSLANTTPNGFGAGWTHPYNMRVEIPSGTTTFTNPNGVPAYLVLPNSTRLRFLAAYRNGITFDPLPAGVPMTMACDSLNRLYLYFNDGSRWTFALKSTGTNATYYPTQISNRTGQSISLVWSAMTYADSAGNVGNYDAYRSTSSAWGLTAINDSSSNALLTLNYTSRGRFANAVDRYGRKIIYNVDAPVQSTGVPASVPVPHYRDELIGVSQMVTTGQTSGPARFSYGYEVHGNGETVSGAVEMVPFLHTIGVPSPTGTGTSTATINYDDTNAYNVGLVKEVVDANDNHTTFSPAMVGTTAQPNSARVTTRHTATGAVASQYDVYFDAAMNQTALVNAAGQTVWTRSYGNSSAPYSPTSVTDGNSHTWSRDYDYVGHVLWSQSPKGTKASYTYRAGTNVVPNDLQQVSSVSFQSSSAHFSGPNNLVDYVTTPRPGTSAALGSYGTVERDYTYTSYGQVRTVTVPANNVTTARTWTYEYNGDGTYSQPERMGQPIKITDPLGHATHYRYDAHGNVISITDAKGDQTQYQYTFDDRLWKTIAPFTGWGSGGVTSVESYLYTGGPKTGTEVFDENGVSTRSVAYTYGNEGEPVARTGSAEAFADTYDAAYRPKTLSDGKGNLTTYTYDLSGRLTKVAYPLASGAYNDQVQYSNYDPVGHALTRTDGNGLVTNYEYLDGDGLLSAIKYPAAAANNVSLHYDARDRMDSTTDPSGTSSTVYDDLGDATSETTTYNGLQAYTFTYGYYPDGSRKTMGNVVGTWTYTYDAAGRYASMVSPAGTASATYYDNGWQATRTLPNGLKTTYGYHENGAPESVWNASSDGSVTYSSYGPFGYDGVYNLTSVPASVPLAGAQTGTTTYGYDAKDRLTSETSTRPGGFSRSNQYDASGNPTTFAGATQTFDADNRRSGTGYAYDGNGNPTTYKGASLSFDPESRATSVGASFSAGYRADGLRAWKSVSGVNTYYLYDRGEPVVEVDANGPKAINVYAPDGLVATLRGSSWLYFLFDAQGSVAQRTDASGGTYSATAYDAYGTESVVGTAPTDPFGYNARSGYVYDRETGLYYCRNRYYDPQNGRWLTRDPVGYTGGINLYGYCAGSPVGHRDPRGLQMSPAGGGYMPTEGGGDDGAAAEAAQADDQAALDAEVGAAGQVQPPSVEAPLGAEPESAPPLPEGSPIPATATSAAAEPGWYTGVNNKGVPYVGSSTDLFSRVGPGHHQLDLKQGVDLFLADDCSITRRELEIEEQTIINVHFGGLSKVSNVRNPVAEKYWPLYGIPRP